MSPKTISAAGVVRFCSSVSVFAFAAESFAFACRASGAADCSAALTPFGALLSAAEESERDVSAAFFVADSAPFMQTLPACVYNGTVFHHASIHSLALGNAGI